MTMSSCPHEGPPTALVSLCIPTYNNADMVGDALRSAMSQTYENLEIVVLDNHSTDATESVVKREAGGDPRVRYVRHETNVGMTGNFNQALSRSSGDLILILCADDVLEPSCAAMLADALSKESGAVLAACSRQVVDADLNPIKVLQPRRTRQVVTGSALVRECFARGNIIGEPSGVMFRRSASVRGFSENYNQLLDLEMWFHLLSQGDAVFLPDVLSKIRRHADQWSNTNARNGRVIGDKRALFRDVVPLHGKGLTATQKLLWDLRMAVSLGRTSLAEGQRASEVQEVFHPLAFGLLRRVAKAAYSAGSLIGPRA